MTESIEAGIWLAMLYTEDGKLGHYAIVATDERAIEILHSGVRMREMNSLEDALMAAESQGGSIQ